MIIRSFIPVLVAASAVLLCPATVRAQASVSLETSVTAPRKGEWFRIQVTVTNPSTATTPSPPDTEDFEFRILGRNPSHSSEYYNINGVEQRSEKYVYTFEARPLRGGRLIMPPFVVKDGARTLQSNSLRMHVGEPDPTPYLICRVRTNPPDRIYIGQEVTAALEIWVRKFTQGQWELSLNDSYSLIDFNNSSLGVFASAGSPRAGQTTRRGANGEAVQYYVYQLETTLFPTKPGPLELGDIEITLLYPVRLSRDIFGRIAFAGEPRRIREKPELPKLSVQPIPQENRPADFNGAVGSYSISTVAKPTEVAVGDPITLTLVIKGGGALERLSPPRLDQVEALTRDFEVAAASVAGEVSAGTKMFSVTIRPLREDVLTIPPIPMSYFDPETGTFATALSEPIPLKVRPAEKLALSELPSGGVFGGGLLGPLVESTDGLLPNETNPDRLLVSQSMSLGSGGWAILTLSPALYLAAFLLQRRMLRLRQDDAYRRRHGAYRRARRALVESDGVLSPGQVRAAVLGYVADRCNVPAGGLTRGEAVALLNRRRAPADASRSLDNLLEELEQLEYGGVAGGTDPALLSRAMALLEVLERCKLT